jgi:cholesterol transport system auxiliary component
MHSPGVQQGDPIPVQLVVMEPQASALLDSPRIVVRDEAGQLAQLAAVALPDRAPRWLQNQLVQRLSNHPFAAVAAPSAGIKPDLQLIVRIERFEVDYRGSAQASVVLHALLLDARSARAVGSARFAQDTPSEGSGSKAGAEALQRAAYAALSALAVWVEGQARGSAERSD